ATVGIGVDAAVVLCRNLTAAFRRVAGAGVVALIEGGADDGVGPDAGAGLAGVGLGAGVAVGAGAAVGLGRIRAGAVRRIAGAGEVGRMACGAGDGGGRDGGAGLVGVVLVAGVVVGAVA